MYYDNFLSFGIGKLSFGMFLTKNDSELSNVHQSILDIEIKRMREKFKRDMEDNIVSEQIKEIREKLTQIKSMSSNYRPEYSTVISKLVDEIDESFFAEVSTTDQENEIVKNDVITKRNEDIAEQQKQNDEIVKRNNDIIEQQKQNDVIAKTNQDENAQSILNDVIAKRAESEAKDIQAQK